MIKIKNFSFGVAALLGGCGGVGQCAPAFVGPVPEVAVTASAAPTQEVVVQESTMQEDIAARWREARGADTRPGGVYETPTTVRPNEIPEVSIDCVGGEILPFIGYTKTGVEFTLAENERIIWDGFVGGFTWSTFPGDRTYRLRVWTRDGVWEFDETVGPCV